MNERASEKEKARGRRATSGRREREAKRKERQRRERKAKAHLVELERIEQIVQLAVLGALLEADKVLLQSVERELLLVVDVNLEGLFDDVEVEAKSSRG